MVSAGYHKIPQQTVVITSESKLPGNQGGGGSLSPQGNTPSRHKTSTLLLTPQTCPERPSKDGDITFVTEHNRRVLLAWAYLQDRWRSFGRSSIAGIEKKKKPDTPPPFNVIQRSKRPQRSICPQASERRNGGCGGAATSSVGALLAPAHGVLVRLRQPLGSHRPA